MPPPDSSPFRRKFQATFVIARTLPGPCRRATLAREGSDPELARTPGLTRALPLPGLLTEVDLLFHCCDAQDLLQSGARLSTAGRRSAD